ncbi:electron transport complex subunit E [Sulfuriflexus sp.]|uniref:electron transport complex subunit E n=1 Tax=Sulfuriflexus sp. TaxID=2015443 RepID=UPI0028CC4ED9|nr:electron transport complex subunit E [Sulfuriflexus sp.]MDT8404509.1 electron transport complex subunit E [Sulfuriflexus sp.]
MSDAPYRDIVKQGLWNNNQALVALLGLCPLLAVSSTAINGLGLGVATMATLTITNLLVASIRRWLRSEIRIPMFVIIIACVVTAIELLMSAHLHDLYLVLGIFVPLIVTNCAIIGRAEAFASKNNVILSTLDGIVMGLGFTLVLLILGIVREIIGYGTIFRNAELMLGEWAAQLTIVVLPGYEGLLLAILPPGAFMGLALLIAMKNKIDTWQSQRIKNRESVSVDLQASRI